MAKVNDLIIVLKEEWQDKAEIEAEAENYSKAGYTVVIAERGRNGEADISSRNFRGEVHEHNQHGYRQFSLKFNDEGIMTSLIDLGWPINVKQYDDQDTPVGYMTVFVNFDNPKKLPHIKSYSRMPDGQDKENIIYPETVGDLDKADINSIKLHLTYYEGTNRFSGKPYVKVYLADMSFNIVPERPSVFDGDKRAREAIKSVNIPEIVDNLPFDA